MARMMNVNNTDIYRLLVTRKWPDGTQHQCVYGPHDSPAHAKYYGAQWCDNPTRLEKQQLMAWIRFDEADSPYSILEWTTIKTTYTNGGEGVEWDE